MQGRFLRLTAMAAAVGAMSLATATLAADPPISIDKLGYSHFEGWGGEWGSTYSSFEVHQNINGIEVSVDWQSGGGAWSKITCYSQALSNVSLVVTPQTASVKALLDPASPDCYIVQNVSEAVWLEVSGIEAGTDSWSATGRGTSMTLDETWRFNYREFRHECAFSMVSPIPLTGFCWANSFTTIDRYLEGK